jgi:putative protease
MLKLLSPAGSPEAVIAAVQSGADIIYIGYGVTGAGKTEMNMGFSAEEFTQSMRYCRVRGCGVAVTMNDLISDEGMTKAVDRAVFAADLGADAIIVQDVGLARAIRAVLPDIPLWGGVRMSVHNLGGALAAADLGLERIVLAQELTLEQIRAISQSAPIKTVVYVHGQLCFAHSGQCYLSVMRDRHRSDSCGTCSEPCRLRYSLGGRLDDRPMSMKDICLLDHLRELDEAGVSVAAIEGRSRRPEYVAFATRLYARAIKEGVLPTNEEQEWLTSVWSPGGLTDGYLTGVKGPTMFSAGGKPDRDAPKIFADVRKSYMSTEMRRVPLKFYVVIQQGQQAVFAAEDNRGNHAVYKGYVPIDLGREGISSGHVEDLMYRTGGTPFLVEEVNCVIDRHMDYPDEAIETARRELLTRISSDSRNPKPRVRGNSLEKPSAPERTEPPKFIVQVMKAEQLTEDLACCEPDYLYIPAELIAAGCPALSTFVQRGTVPVAILPRIVTDKEMPALRELLAAVNARGVNQALAGNLGLARPVREAGMLLRGDFGLNISNSWSLAIMKLAGFSSVTASFQLSGAQIKDLAKTADTEMIVYGRMPVMVTDQCIIRNSSGRCSCGTPTDMGDESGNIYPVEKEFGCRNVIYDAKKIFLADRQSIYTNAGLWAVRLLFSTESARECADVAKRYRGLSNYRPNNLSRGLYPKGAL